MRSAECVIEMDLWLNTFSSSSNDETVVAVAWEQELKNDRKMKGTVEACFAYFRRS